MQTFLDEIARDILHRYKAQLADICIVFPNRRAGLFFRKYLSEILTKPIWCPDILTINDFFSKYTPWQTADQITLLFELYQTWLEVSKKNESFDNFYFWGESLLKDFDDIDKYLARAEKLFQMVEYQKNLDEQFKFLEEEQIEAIKQFWSSFDINKPSSHQEQFLYTWKLLVNVYQKFKKNLQGKNWAYEGMNYRNVVENLDKHDFTHQYSKIIFIGFNALNKCEEKLFDYLQEKEIAEYYWDMDESYISDVYNEAGSFLRKNIKRYKKYSYFPLSKEMYNEKEIKVIGVPLEVGQAKTAASILEKYQYAPEQSAVILPDEHLLFPVLYSIPEYIKKMNVTMGYPFKDTQLFSFIDQLMELQQSAQQRNGKWYFHYHSVLTIVKHSYVFTYQPELAKKIIEQIEKENCLHVSFNEELINNTFFQLIFKPISQIHELTSYFLEIVNHLYQLVKKEKLYIQEEYFFHFTLSLKRLNEVLGLYKIDLTLQTFYKLVRKIFQYLRIPFDGEPLEGLQIMGLMETRCLDFENIMILSLNEGIVPSKSVSVSFIPYNIRKGFHLPVSDQQEAIFAYYFYRSIQRAKNIYLFYNTEVSDKLSGEMSRYLYQLKYHTNFKNIEFSVLNRKINVTKPTAISISSNSTILEKLNKYIVKNQNQADLLSPSALNTYLDCRLKFYFKYVADLKEKKEKEEELSKADFGNLLHKTIEILYKPYMRKEITNEILKEIKTKISDAILFSINEHQGNSSSPLPKQVLDKSWGEIESGAGKIILIQSVLEEYIKGIVNEDSKYIPFQLLGVELGHDEKIYMDIPCTIGNEKCTIRIGGKIDRVDIKEGVVRILDYKTGLDSTEIKDIASLFDRNFKQRNKAAFQTLLYSLLYQKKYAASSVVRPALFKIKEIFSENFNTHFTLSKDPIVNIDFIGLEYQQHLQLLLEELFNAKTIFDQTDDSNKCKNCAYAAICSRELNS